MKGKTLVAVAAHADDVEINAGGLVAKWAAAGGTVHIVMMTNNCSGNILPVDGDESKVRRLFPAATTEIRHREQDAAAALIGARTHYMDYNQRHYWHEDLGRVIDIGYESDVPAPPGVAGKQNIIIAANEQADVARLAAKLVSLQPDLVVTQPLIDLDPEHHAVACLVWQAIRSRRDEMPGVTLQFWTPGSSAADGMFDPAYDTIVDVTDHMPMKLKLCEAHQSQMTAYRWQIVKERAAKWGKRIGVPYAEPFKTAML